MEIGDRKIYECRESRMKEREVEKNEEKVGKGEKRNAETYSFSASRKVCERVLKCYKKTCCEAKRTVSVS